MNKKFYNCFTAISSSRFTKAIVCFLFLLSFAPQKNFAQASFGALDVAVTENFNGLGTAATYNLTDNSSITGVYALRATANATPNVFTLSAGSPSSGNFYNYGTGTNADRALGGIQSSATGTLNYGVRYKNNTGSTIYALTISYAGEEWRQSTGTGINYLTFDYRQAASITDLTGTYTAVTALNFASPVPPVGGTAVLLDGNASANRTVVTATIAVTIPVGEEIMLRWTDVDDSGLDCGLAIDDLSVTPKGATNYYYTGSGSLIDVNNWGTSSNGSGARPANFTTDYQVFNIVNTTAAATVLADGTWTVSGTASKVVLGRTTDAAITLTLAAGTGITVPTTSFDITLPATGHHKIVYQNSSTVSLGTINDPDLELVYDGATLSTSTSKTYGNVSLINNANVDMNNATIVVKNLTIDAGSTLSGAYLSTRYIAIKSGGSVVINGTFKTGRPGGLVSINIPIPVTTTTTNNALLFEGSESLTLGVASTIEYYRGTSGNAGVQTIEARTYSNLTLSNSGVSNNKIFAAGTTTVSGNLTVNTFAGTETVTLSGNVTTNTLTLTTGKVILGANTLTATTISGGSSNAYVVTDGAGVLTSPTTANTLKIFPIGASISSYDPVEVTPTTGVSFSAKVSAAAPSSVSNSANMAQRQWDVSATGAGSTIMSLTNGGTLYTPTTASMGHYTGAVWEEFTATYSANKWTATNASGSFSPFGGGERGAFNSAVLFVELSNFQVKANQKSALLSWTTTSEKDNAYFNIEQSTNGMDFQTIGQVKGHGTTSSVYNYTFTDNTLPLGVGGLYYRLKQVDFNGLATYSAVKSIIFGKTGLIIKNTLVHDALDIITNEDAATPLSIFNVSGQQVFNAKAQGAQRIDVSALSTGLYIVRTATGEVGRFVKQ